MSDLPLRRDNTAFQPLLFSQTPRAHRPPSIRTQDVNDMYFDARSPWYPHGRTAREYEPCLCPYCESPPADDDWSLVEVFQAVCMIVVMSIVLPVICKLALFAE